MDSITQIVLGAAVGEAAMGKKLGNRAMLYGAIGGTIPDLDILANFVADDMTALAFHRGISHSFFFAFTAPIVFGWLTHKFYSSGIYKKKSYRAIAIGLWVTMIGLIMYGINSIPKAASGEYHFPTIFITLSILGLIVFHFRNYYTSKPDDIQATWKDWAILYFWAIFTHPLLDACTTYGTQLFQPFSDYRVAFNNIAVADPGYTVPFLVCLIIAGYLTRNTSRRKFFNWLGIGLSSAYLLFSVYNKHRINKVFEQSFAENNITYERYMTSPTIFSNALWQGVAETDSAYYHGMYSIFDSQPKVLEINQFDKNHHLLGEHFNDPDVETLKWFSNNYYNVTQDPNGTLYINDLRFGTRKQQPENHHSNFVFSFRLEEKDGVLEAHETREIPEDPNQEFKELFERIKGL